MRKRIKRPIKRLSTWLVAVLMIQLFQSLLIMPARASAQEPETYAGSFGVFSFGFGLYGNLGHGNENDQSTPKQIAGLYGIKAISAGTSHSLVLTESGDMYSFGNNSRGQLGHGITDNESTPRKIENLPAIKAIASGDNYSLVLTETGEVFSSGSNSYGQLGHGDTDDQYFPKKIENLPAIKAIAVGLNHSLILAETGEVYSFGSGASGNLGHGDTLDQSTPKKIEGLSGIQAIAIGGYHSLVLTESGEVYSFGYNVRGQLGHGDTDDQYLPKKIESLTSIRAIAAGKYHSLALTESGDVYSFGYGSDGQLGHGDADNHYLPKKIEGLPAVESIAAGDVHSLVLTESGDVFSFGDGWYGKLGHGDMKNQITPKKIEGLPPVEAISGGGHHSLLLAEISIRDSEIQPSNASFDKNAQLQQDIDVTMDLNGNRLTRIMNGATPLTAGMDYTILGNTVTIMNDYLATLPVGTVTLEFVFSAGAVQSLIIEIIETDDDHDSGVFSFGYGSTGQLGHGDEENQLAPRKIEDLSNIQAIAAGTNHSLALTMSGDVYSFGSGTFGQLGHGDTNIQLTPKKIEGMSNIQAIAAGGSHSLALTESGDMYSFGSGSDGQLGHGDTNDQLTPKKIEGLSNIQAIAAGGIHSLALTESGDVYSFGFGRFGRLGLGNTADQHTPMKITGLSNIQAIAAGTNHSLALTESGDVYSFGSGSYGQLGHGETKDQLTPKKIEGLSNIQAIAAGGSYSLVLTKSGVVYSFGDGAAGRLGHGNTQNQLTPKKIEGMSNIRAIAAGGAHSLALIESGEVFSFGSGFAGQLGHGDTEIQLTPKQIDGLSNVKAISAAFLHSLVLVAIEAQDSTIHPGTASFDKHVPLQEDTVITMELNGNTLTGIMNGTTLLTADKDYTIDDNRVTITKAYLATLPIGVTTLQFTFSAGAAQDLTVTVSDSTPMPPTHLQATPGDGEVALNWTATGTADGYNIYRQEAVDGMPPDADRWIVVNDERPVTGTSYTVDNLTAGKLYWFAVTAVKEALESDFSDPTSEMPYTTVTEVVPPRAIEVGKGLAREKLEKHLPEHIQVQLASLPLWMDVDVKWDVEYANYNPDQVGTYAVTGELQLPEYVRNPQTLQAEIAVTVLPSTNARLSGITLNGEPLQDFDPDVYTYYISVSYAIEQVTVTAATYDLMANYEVVGEVVHGEVQPLKMGPNLIKIQVTAEDQQATATYILRIERQRDAEAPQWPEDSELTVSNITQTSIKLSWPSAADNVGVTGYRIYVNGVEHETVSGGVYTANIIGLTANTTYTFNVSAFDAEDNESAELTASAQTLPRPPDPDTEAPTWPGGSELDVSDITKTSMKLSWPAATDNVGVTGYRIYVNGVERETVSGSVYAATITRLTENTTYTLHVTAFDAEDNESTPLSKQVTTARSSGEGGSDNGSDGGGYQLSDNANLTDLELWVGGEPLKLSPSFAPGTTEYTARTEAGQVEIVAKEAHSMATLILDDQIVTDRVKVDLTDGDNVFVLTVQAENGTKKKYTLTIIREAPKPSEPAIKFTDIAGHWAEGYIMRAASKGIVSGYPDRTFKPDNPITRAEFTVMLTGVLSLEGKGAALTFTDHDQIGLWAKQSVAQALQEGIVSGYEDGSFRPNAKITRAEMAVMIARALKAEVHADATTDFSDDETIPRWAIGAVEAIRKHGIVDGRGGNRFVPNDKATRAEATVMLLRMLERKDNP